MNFEQSIPLSFAFAYLSGFLNVVATASLAYANAKSEESSAAGGEPWSKWPLRLACATNVVIQFLSGCSSTVSAFFGPVALVRPTSLAALLFSNMIIFSYLGLEKFPKDQQVGTLVVLVGTLSLPVNGPGVQQNQDIVELVTHPIALIWSTLLIVTTYGSAIYMTWKGLKTVSKTWTTILLLCAQVGSAVIGTTTAKMFVLVDAVYLAPLVFLWASTGAIILYATVLQSTAVSQAFFVPLNVALDIAINAITGLVFWEDWRVVDSWLGYLCVFLQLGLGNYLLSSFDLSRTADALDTARQCISKVMSSVVRHQSSLFSDPKDLTNTEEETAPHQDEDDRSSVMVQDSGVDASDRIAGAGADEGRDLERGDNPLQQGDGDGENFVVDGGVDV